MEKHLLTETGLRFFGGMSASISHEIKNVLAIINENAGLLKDIALMAERRPISPERLERLAEAVLKQVQRADGIVKTMNRFSHGVDLFTGTVELNEMLVFASRLFARLVEMRGDAVEAIPAPAAVTAATSSFLLQNLVWRCLDFATRSPPASKKIRMTAEENEDGPLIRIFGLAGLDEASRGAFPSGEENALLSALGAELVLDVEEREIRLLLPGETDGASRSDDSGRERPASVSERGA